MASPAFARGHLVDLLAELLPAVELARICSVSARFYRHAATLAFASVRAQHGLMIPDASLAEMHGLDSVQEAQRFDMRKQETRRGLRGSPLCTTYVGSYRDKITLAQIPPASGDAWSIDCSLRRGAYLMTLEGWGNPAHGILDLFLDGRRIGTGSTTTRRCAVAPSSSTCGGRACTNWWGDAAVPTPTKTGRCDTGSV